MFLQNAWYVAAWNREVGRAPLARTILGESVVLYRKHDGTAVALEDRCCHRQLPLSMGVVIDDDLRCGYHGLRYAADGACIDVPGQSSIPAELRVRSFPVLERWNWIWIWMGDPVRADPGLIPNWWWCDHPQWRCSQPDMIHVKCHYQLIADNVLDGTHLAYVHSTTIGADSIAAAPPKTERKDHLVRVTRWIADRPPPPLYQLAGNFTGNVDRWANVEHAPPCYSVNFAGCVEAGKSNGKRVELVALSAPTPETLSTTHYFFAFSRAFAHDDPVVEDIFTRRFVDVFREDVAVLEAQQRMMTLKPGARQVNIAVDVASLAARRLLEGMIAAEQQRRDVPPTA
ncbi:MAG TPA: aromatic ring-hydroxylating dioxygenase subunit alpha [Stellaceae bacterium]|nr:aromatic ring-hydroxylating dioxygenase subunit alpha [Stellaceae bacterium]